MLKGKENFIAELFKKAKDIATQNNFKLIYAANTGGISREIERYDSDFDIRFLFIKADYPNKVYLPHETEESEIVYRYFPREDEKADHSFELPYDRIAFWEVTSFVRLLVNPAFKGGIWYRTGLYYIVEHTFLSPYTWDPHGIQVKVLPLITQLRDQKLVLQYYLDLINKERSRAVDSEVIRDCHKRYFNKDEKTIHDKDYVEDIWSALSIKWCLDHPKILSPVNINTLISNVGESLAEKLKKVIRQAYDKSVEHIKNGIDIDSFERSDTRKYLTTERQQDIDEFIISHYLKAEDFIKNTTIEEKSEAEKTKLLSDLDGVIKNSVFDKKVNNINE